MIAGYKFVLSKDERKSLSSFVSEIKEKQSSNLLLSGSFIHFLKGDVVFLNIPKPYPNIFKTLAFVLLGGIFLLFGLTWFMIVPVLILLADMFADVLPALGFKLGLRKKKLKLEIKRMKNDELLTYLEVNYVSKRRS